MSAATAASLSWANACAALPGRPSGPGPFQHGVASGDPLTDRVILWTRVTPRPDDGGDVAVEWRLGRDPELRDPLLRGRATASAERDFTVKVDATGLEPGTTWYYGFEALGFASPRGRTRTLPGGSPDRLRLAFCSCANLPWGYFNAYAHIARRADLDAVLHLGDYLYEHANGTYGDGSEMGRVPMPDREIVSLSDYRTRHAQYKADLDAQAMHRQHPMIAVWDDHELANDAWKGGAQGHQPEREGDWAARRDAAVRAYLEWMPIRARFEAGETVIYRDFRFGDLADLVMLDTRLVGRDRQLERQDPALDDPARSMLGDEQERWLFERLAASKGDEVAWRLLGQQVLLAPARRIDGSILGTDKWDGYPAARGRLFDMLERQRVKDVVILSGDLHSSWALDVPRDPFSRRGYDRARGRGALAVEFLTPGISAPGLLDPEKGARVVAELLESNPHLRWVDFMKRGYAVLDLDRDGAQCEWYHVDDVSRRGADAHFAKAWRTQRGRSQLVEVASPSPPPVAAPLA